MNRLLTKDFLAGLMFFGVGLLAYLTAFTDLSRYVGQSRLPLGTPVRMGPGYVPHMLSFIMMALGVIIAVWSIRDLVAIGILKSGRVLVGGLRRLPGLEAARAERLIATVRSSAEIHMKSVRIAVAPGDLVEALKLKPILMISLGVIAFGTLLDPNNVPAVVSWFKAGLPRWENPVSGMLPALVVLVFLAALGGEEFHLLETIAMCTVLYVICFGIFKFGLGMNIASITALPVVDEVMDAVFAFLVKIFVYLAFGGRPFTIAAAVIGIIAFGLQWYRRRQQPAARQGRGDIA